MSLFVTGTDTGVGKTHTVTQLLRLLRDSSPLRCAGMKPICCGDRNDAELLLGASTRGPAIDEINPIWLKTPSAPFTASLLEKTDIDLGRVFSAFAELKQKMDHVFVEGVGGWMVPIRSDYLVSDLAVEMKLPVLVVARNRLGCLNHTLLTVRSVQSLDLMCAGVVLNELTSSEADVAASTNADILGRILDVPILSGLTANMAKLPSEWARIVGHASS